MADHDDDTRTGLVPDDLLTLKDAQRELGVGRTLMYRLIADGEIAAINHGSRQWIERTEIAAYWARRRDEAAKARVARARAAATKNRTTTTTPADRKKSDADASSPARPSAA